MADPVLRLGILGLGRAFMLMLPTLAHHPRVRLVAAADPRPDARRRFAEEFGARTYETAEALAADPAVDAVYIATPHQFHVAQVGIMARAGKHILVEKPMALTLPDCQAMIDAARTAGVHLMVGHSHSYDGPIAQARRLIGSGAYGPVRMITAVNFTDFLYRPRRPEELVTAEGGGVVFSQAAHQVDIVRLLGGGRVKSVRAQTGAWDPARPTEGAYGAFLSFESGAFANLTYSGYGHFDIDEFVGWVGELGQERDPARYGTARAALARIRSAAEEAALKETRTYGAPASLDAAALPAGGVRHHNHFGQIIVSCAGADLRPTADGVHVYADQTRRFDALPPPAVPRPEVIDELYRAAVQNIPPDHSGAWGLSTLEVCLAILHSARAGREIPLTHQVAIGE
ncbi:MAG: 4,5-dihydroxyphthalate dehydrogenase [Rhodospirillales bacterium]|nr:4,5-dihydroxyphthalate dehydrogenase [Rhodospirillales bacterium]